MPRYAGYDSDFEQDDDVIPEGCLPMSKLRSIARSIKRRVVFESTGMGEMARKRLKAKAAAVRRAMDAKWAQEKAVEDAKKDLAARSCGIGIPVEEAKTISNVVVA